MCGREIWLTLNIFSDLEDGLRSRFQRENNCILAISYLECH